MQESFSWFVMLIVMVGLITMSLGDIWMIRNWNFIVFFKLLMLNIVVVFFLKSFGMLLIGLFQCCRN